MIKEYGYEYDAIINHDIYINTKGISTQKKLWNGFCFRSGRDALKAIAREFSPTTVLIPALACDSMISPFEMYGHNICYYRLKPNYEIDIDDLQKKIPEKEALLLYMDYFAKPSICDKSLEDLSQKYKKLYFIRDVTHNLFSYKSAVFIPDFTVVSLRKWINIPDGGLLWSKNPLKNEAFKNDLSFSEIRLKAQIMRNDFLKTGEASIKTQYRKIFSQVSELLDNSDVPVRMSEYAYQIAKNTDWNEIKAIRKQNAEQLIEILKKTNVSLIQKCIELSDLYVAFTVENRDAVQSTLSKKGIFNTIIWPLREEQVKACDVAARVQSNMLAAPCDQRYTVEDMKYIGKEIARVVSG